MNPKEKESISIELLKEVIERGDEIPLKTYGFSMGYTIRNGDWIKVKKTNTNNIRCGDIIIFQGGTKFICHRVITKRNGNIFTKGDSYLNLDNPIPEDKIIAKVTELNTNGRTIKLDTILNKTINRFIGIYFLIIWHIYRTFINLIPGLKRINFKRKIIFYLTWKRILYKLYTSMKIKKGVMWMKRVYRKPVVESEVLERTALTCNSYNRLYGDQGCSAIGQNFYEECGTVVRGDPDCASHREERSA